MTMLMLNQQGWYLYELHWYRQFKIELYWISAENYCRTFGGNLVSIMNKRENDFVDKIREKNNIWIGLNKFNDTFGVYKWSDGSQATYLNWDSTQPNEPNVHCVYMKFNEHQATWFDYSCHTRSPMSFVCKLKAF
ncbi:unnamed protein product [Dracunculus medinensis]|uniref:C-type lectin domain-containing protein n=1 Tax=Dracunculus medinensis TaxID=318479 RepID=A0A0N4UJJ1_DRAME|nr:unnamed protein product [Dracunculus medinensis]